MPEPNRFITWEDFQRIEDLIVATVEHGVDSDELFGLITETVLEHHADAIIAGLLIRIAVMLGDDDDAYINLLGGSRLFIAEERERADGRSVI